MTGITIRAYVSADLEPCRVLWAALTQHHRDLYGDPTIGGDQPGLYFDELLTRAGPERLWVAERDGQVVGVTGLLVNGREAEVEPLVVLPNARGQGIGRLLVERAVEAALSLNVRYLSVRPVARNVRAISFFHASGFQTLGHIELFMDLKPKAPGAWRPGPELFGLAFDY